ncbi:MAG: 6-phosphogluconolactonase [Saprospiraceae bacterium]|nr:6-phosphogluconolactonase [Saprospiraceae bacterium]
MKIHIFKTEAELLVSLANFLIETATKAIAERGQCNVALSGGRSPKKLYALLASPEFNPLLDWQKIYFFFGDERYVPATSPDSNALMAQKALFDPLQIAPAQIFRVDTTLSPTESANAYTDAITTHFQQQPVCFDLILLGLGDNAHTASLFRHTSVLAETTAAVKAVFLEEQQVYRITMTAPLINQARQIAFLVYGADKAEAVQQVLAGARNIEQYPAQLIRPTNGEVHWFLDEAAA